MLAFFHLYTFFILSVARLKRLTSLLTCFTRTSPSVASPAKSSVCSCCFIRECIKGLRRFFQSRISCISSGWKYFCARLFFSLCHKEPDFSINGGMLIRLGMPLPAVPQSRFKAIFQNCIFNEDRFQIELVCHCRLKSLHLLFVVFVFEHVLRC